MGLLKEINNNTQSGYVLFVDLDGVLADFVKGVTKLIPDYNEAKYQQDPKYRTKMWKAVGNYTKDGGKLWAELDLMPDAMVLWDYISKYDTTEILTATGDLSFGADVQKRDWVSKNFGNIKTNVVEKSKEKAQYAAPNHILIDDMQKSIGPWEQSGGIGILHTNAADTISKLKKLGL